MNGKETTEDLKFFINMEHFQTEISLNGSIFIKFNYISLNKNSTNLEQKPTGVHRIGKNLPVGKQGM